jgi:hypothetical protein
VNDDLDEARFRWEHPDVEAWATRQRFSGLAALVLALGGAVALLGGVQLSSPGARPTQVWCPGDPACAEALPQWFVDRPPIEVVETAVHNRLVRGLQAREDALVEAMRDKVVVGRIERNEAGELTTEDGVVVEADGRFTTTDTLLGTLAIAEGLELETAPDWVRELPTARLPVEERLALAADFPMRADAEAWIDERTQGAIEVYSEAIDTAYAAATMPVVLDSMKARTTWTDQLVAYVRSMIGLGLFGLAATFLGLFGLAGRRVSMHLDRHVRLTRHRLEEVTVGPGSVVRHPRITGVVRSIAIGDASDAELAAFIAELGRVGHALTDDDLKRFRDAVAARRRASADGQPLDEAARRAMDAIRQGAR